MRPTDRLLRLQRLSPLSTETIWRQTKNFDYLTVYSWTDVHFKQEISVYQTLAQMLRLLRVCTSQRKGNELQTRLLARMQWVKLTNDPSCFWYEII